MMRRLAAGLAALALAGCATEREAAELMLPTRTSSLADVQVVTSPGGITAWLVSESFVPMISMEWTWSGGASVEPAGLRGIGWVLAYMMNEGAS